MVGRLHFGRRCRKIILIPYLRKKSATTMFGNIQEQQEKMRQRLTQIEVSAQAGGGAIQIRANAARQILDIKIDPELSLDDHEELEDLLLTAMNRVLAAAAEKEAAETENMLKDILPPGMGDLGGMFGF